ncbi:uncharacterized protein LOC144371002 [Ictidomys tridecemlineatus]
MKQEEVTSTLLIFFGGVSGNFRVGLEVLVSGPVLGRVSGPGCLLPSVLRRGLRGGQRRLTVRSRLGSGGLSARPPPAAWDNPAFPRRRPGDPAAGADGGLVPAPRPQQESEAHARKGGERPRAADTRPKPSPPGHSRPQEPDGGHSRPRPTRGQKTPLCSALSRPEPSPPLSPAPGRPEVAARRGARLSARPAPARVLGSLPGPDLLPAALPQGLPAAAGSAFQSPTCGARQPAAQGALPSHPLKGPTPTDKSQNLLPRTSCASVPPGNDQDRRPRRFHGEPTADRELPALSCDVRARAAAARLPWAPPSLDTFRTASGTRWRRCDRLQAERLGPGGEWRVSEARAHTRQARLWAALLHDDTQPKPGRSGRRFPVGAASAPRGHGLRRDLQTAFGRLSHVSDANASRPARPCWPRAGRVLEPPSVGPLGSDLGVPPQGSGSGEPRRGSPTSPTQMGLLGGSTRLACSHCLPVHTACLFTLTLASPGLHLGEGEASRKQGRGRWFRGHRNVYFHLIPTGIMFAVSSGPCLSTAPVRLASVTQ